MKNILRLLFLALFKKEIKINIYDTVGEYVLSHIEVSHTWNGVDNIVLRLENKKHFKYDKRNLL